MSILLLAYISDASGNFSDSEMEALLKECRENNEKVDVTGMLLYAGDKFLQILEGDPTVVQDLYAKIETDSRHKNPVVMDTQLSEARNFSEWSMGYQCANAATVAKELDGYLDTFEDGKLVLNKKSIKQLSVNILLNAFKRIVDAQEVAP